MQALSCCNSNTMAMILGSSSFQGNVQDTFTVIDPISVGDGIFHILSTLNRKATDVRLIVTHVMEYLASGFQGSRLPGISRLSEPLLWFILQVLDCDNTIQHFLQLGMSPACYVLLCVVVVLVEHIRYAIMIMKKIIASIHEKFT